MRCEPVRESFLQAAMVRKIRRLFGFLAFASALMVRADCPSSPLPVITEPLAGDGGSFFYDQIVDDWLSATDVTYVRSCNVGGQPAMCLLVPKYDDSGVCTIGKLSCGICGLADGTATRSRYCMVTDELSQVGLALAMAKSTNAVAHFAQWVNTVKWLREGTEDDVPAWVARVNAPVGVTATIESHSTDDASDATARIILALYIAANNPEHAANAAAYEELATKLAHVFSFRDFKDTRKRYGADRFWLAGGRGAASGPLQNNNPYMWAGYYGDSALAMLAAYRATGEDRYRERARDILANYLRAAAFTSTFRVPPVTFAWNNGTVDRCEGCDQSNTWDYADAPRAVSLCKALRYAIDGGASLDPDVMSTSCGYCDAWMHSDGVAIGSYGYQPKYSLDGLAQGGLQDGYYEVSLGMSLNFLLHTGDLTLRLNQAASRYRPSAKVFTDGTNPEACFGVYRHAFFIVNFGSALGRDRAALVPPLASPAITSAVANGSSASVSFTSVPAASDYEVTRSCNGENFTSPQTVAGSPFNDSGLAAGVTYFYKVRAISGNQRSRFSPMRATTDLSFTSVDPRTQLITVADIESLRAAANDLRAKAGLQPFPFTDPALTAQATPIKSVHIADLRTAIAQARTALSVANWTFTSHAGAGDAITGSAIDELRQAVRACDVLNIRPFSVE